MARIRDSSFTPFWLGWEGPTYKAVKSEAMVICRCCRVEGPRVQAASRLTAHACSTYPSVLGTSSFPDVPVRELGKRHLALLRLRPEEHRQQLDISRCAAVMVSQEPRHLVSAVTATGSGSGERMAFGEGKELVQPAQK